MHKAVCVCRADSLFVKILGIDLAPLDACDLGAHERGSVLEVLWAVLRPDFELSMVSGQSLEMLPGPIGKCGIAAGRVGKRTVEMELNRFKKRACDPTQPFPPQSGGDGCSLA